VERAEEPFYEVLIPRKFDNRKEGAISLICILLVFWGVYVLYGCFPFASVTCPCRVHFDDYYSVPAKGCAFLFLFFVYILVLHALYAVIHARLIYLLRLTLHVALEMSNV